jgi:glycogen debranching enzyme
MQELAGLTGDAELMRSADSLVAAIEQRWVDERRTWGDVRLHGPGTGALAPTLDGLFPMLVSRDQRHVEAAFAELFNAERFWRPFGPSGVAAEEPEYEPDRYWRGDAWPQQIYLMMIAARRHGREEEVRRLAQQLVIGCTRSGFAERWNPETGRALGAVPQGWAALATEGVRVLG